MGGLYCLGQNRNHLCDPHAPANSWYNWTKMVNQSVITAPIKKINLQGSGLLFLWEDTADKIRGDFKHLQKKIGRIANIHLTPDALVVTNHTGSHIHFGSSLYNCEWQRGSSGRLISQTQGITDYDTICGPADDMGPLNDKLLWLQ